MKTSIQTGRRGVTLTELLVALTVALVFIGGVATAFVQVIKASDAAETQIRGHAAARAAVDKISTEVRTVSLSPNPLYREFLIVNNPLAYGDNIDNDRDGRTDEEDPDGFDDDFGASGDWAAVDDTHPILTGSYTEREAYIGVPDLGDASVDEDVVFNQDVLSFILEPTINSPRLRVTYRVGTFDGESNVLLREVTVNPTPGGFGSDPIDRTEPVVFEVVSFNVLGWNANDDVITPTSTAAPYWASEWDLGLKNFPIRVINSPFGTPPFRLPAALHIAITVNGEGIPLEDVSGWPPPGNGTLETITIQSVVNIESIIKDTRYALYIRS